MNERMNERMNECTQACMHTCRHRRGSCGSCRLGDVFVRVGLRCGRFTLAQRFDRESRCLPFREALGYTGEVGLVTVPSNRGHGILGLNFVAIRSKSYCLFIPRRAPARIRPFSTYTGRRNTYSLLLVGNGRVGVLALHVILYLCET